MATQPKTKAQIAAEAKKKKAAADKAAAAKAASTGTASDGAAGDAQSAAATINLQHLTHITSMTQSEQGFCYTPVEVHAPLVAAGLVDIRPDVTDTNGHIATRASAAGIAYVAAQASPFGGAAVPAGTASPFAPAAAAVAGFDAAVAQTAGAAAAPAATAATRTVAKAPEGGFKIVSGVPIPAVTRKFGAKPAVYPFAQLEVGQAFFVPATTARPNPAKSLASTVNSATARFAVEDGTEVKDGQVVPKFKKTRQFALRHIDDGAAFGYPGEKGAGVFRTA